MEWLRENWFWVLLGVGFLWLHTKMHGGAHGHHGHHDHRCDGGRIDADSRDSEDPHARH